MDDDKVQTTTREDGTIGSAYLTVANIQACGVSIEAIEILHQELARAQQTTTGTRLVAELGLDLVDKLRQIAVAAYEIHSQQRHDFLVRRAKYHSASLAILQAEQDRAIDLYMSRSAGRLLFPDILRLEDRHGNFLPASAVHLLTDNL